jgi:hypothetical protein
MAAASDAVASSLYAGLAKLRHVDIEKWCRWRQNVKDIKSDWARFVPAMESFASQRFMAPEAVKSLGEHAKDLKSVDLCHSSQYQGEALSYLLGALKKWKLTSISIDGAIAGSKDFFDALALGSASTLTSLTLKQLPRCDVEALSSLLKAFGNNLQHVELSSLDDVDHAVFPTIGAFCKSLKSLSLGGYQFKGSLLSSFFYVFSLLLFTFYIHFNII